MPDYSIHDPKGWCGDPKRGAAIGRPTIRGDHRFSGRLYLRRVRLDSGGFDCNGTYFGFGTPLYWYSSEDNSIEGTLRANSRSLARSAVLALYPKARIKK